MFSWFSTAVEEKQTALPTKRHSQKSISVPTEQISSGGGPRAKQKAKEAAKALRQWERTRSSVPNKNAPDNSSEEDLDDIGEEIRALDDMSDHGDGSPGDGSPSSAMSPKNTQETEKPLPALVSYEQRVLLLGRGEAVQGETNKSLSTNNIEEEDSEARAAKDRSNLRKLLMREKMLEEERQNKEMVARINDESGVNAVQASRVIVSVARVKLKMMSQKMKMYEEAEAKQNDGNLRARKLMQWTATLSVLSKFVTKMKTPMIRKTMEEMYLKSLPAPPPPPPLAAPPDAGDEELHEKYEAIIERYRPQWLEEGQKALGAEKFEALQNMKDGPASREKKMVAQRCIEQARGVLSQQEYLELLRKAWRLSDDHASLDEYNQAEFARKIANSENQNSSSSTARR